MSAGKLPVAMGFVILIVIGLYLVSLALGAGDGCAPSAAQKDALRARFRPPPAKKSELRLEGCALVGDRLQLAAGACTIAVAEGSGPRSLTLHADSTVHFAFQPQPPDAQESVPFSAEVKPDQPAELTVPKGGANVILSCPLPRCLVQVQ